MYWTRKSPCSIAAAISTEDFWEGSKYLYETVNFTADLCSKCYGKYTDLNCNKVKFEDLNKRGNIVVKIATNAQSTYMYVHIRLISCSNSSPFVNVSVPFLLEEAICL